MTSKEEILNDLQLIFQDVFDDEDLVITNESNAEQIEDWDSLSHIRLVVAIEKRLNIKFSFAELRDLKNVGEMIDLIQGKIGVN
ncbi:acyl carrier protein [Selenomonas sp. oral taxon 138]|uniref:acyl carrier protein n=1 Tax=Selenomonas sp. oral taxon 138 TaxID=712532 RepID=UPI0002A44564|nr:acyl carrier protein [Selenomonas sp. oral taxon 138]EKX95632.1 putative acyl carrier protein [Selenomonas sp. oral taxon 138 str. F0429]